jgi:ATP-dependent RNA helicase HrpA
VALAVILVQDARAARPPDPMETAALTPTPADLRARLPELMLADRQRLARRLDRAAALRDGGPRERALGQVDRDIGAAEARVAARRLAVPVIGYPAELPVSQRKDEIAAAIRDHQVVIVAGETGSGKTTQIPKICLELGRGVTGQIGHTQPRRIAARTVAERIAEELGTELGSAIGYKVRFTDRSSDGTLVKLMTDGILLTELRHDRRLLRYDTLIIDEAHERSLNIDFILGYLHRLLPSRPDLKVIITSATIDPERFASHFAGGESDEHRAGGESSKHRAGPNGQPAPVVEVSGRTYPVEVRYRPLTADSAQTEDAGGRDEPRDQVQGICDAIDELRAAGPGDILVFLSGEREIRDTADALAGGAYADLEVVPLYARLSAAEQHRVFQPHQGRRIVLATNVAETSLTVPGIRYVIDPGTARISRYSNRTKVQRLPIEAISQASANQRKGRCGRTADGICIRLYSEDDFAGRSEFTEPEILRTNLASVILQMAALDLGEVAGFGFIDPPDPRQVTDGVRLLEELGALAQGGARAGGLTELGKQLARLPVDPRLGRMIIESGRNGCAREVLIIAAALSIQDPRERPADARDAADAQHRRFAEPGSDFLALVNLWDYLREQQRELSGSAFRRMCRREYLHYLRVREWQDVYGQLRQAAKELGIALGQDPPARVAEPAAARPAAAQTAARDGLTAHVAQLAARPGAQRPRGGLSDERELAGTAEPRIAAELAERVHRSLLAGLLSHIGMQEVTTGQKRRGPAEFTGARGARFSVFPDSVLARKPPRWVVAAELVETSRLWARVVAGIEPEWAEPLAAHLVNRTYSEPHWDGRRGAAMALERVSLYGLPLVAGRRVTLSRIDPVLARELFISHALVEGDWQTHHRFFHRNRELLAEATELERRARRRGIVADDAALFAFYDRRIPADVTSARHFDAWWKRAMPSEPDLLTLAPADLAGPAAGEVSQDDYPSTWGGLALTYEFAPGEPEDGVAADIPLAALNQVDADEFSWQVPGLREELVTELIRALPKQLRTRFVPAPDVARDVLARLDPAQAGLVEALAAELGRFAGVKVPPGAFDLSRLPAHLRLTFRVTDDGEVVASGTDLDELREELRPRLAERLAAAAGDLTRTGITSWDFESLPRVFAQGQVRAYPALADAGQSVDIRLYETQAAAERAMAAGNRRLILLQVPSGARAVASRLPTNAKLAMSRHPYASAAALLDDCAAAAADEIIARRGGPAWDAKAFAALLDAARSELAARAANVVSAVARILGEAHTAESALDGAKGPLFAPAVADMRAQLAGLVYPGFVAEAGLGRLPDLVRYLRAIAHRIHRAPADVRRDADRMDVVHRVTREYDQVLAELSQGRRDQADVQAVKWMIEELRVSLFAPPIGAAIPVSEQRICVALDRLIG